MLPQKGGLSKLQEKNIIKNNNDNNNNDNDGDDDDDDDDDDDGIPIPIPSYKSLFTTVDVLR